MTDGGTDGRVDQLVKAGWLAIGLSQTDLAEVLGAAFRHTQKDSNGSSAVDAGRLTQVAEALDIPADFRTGQQEPELSSAQGFGVLQSLLELRLLRAFHELDDRRTKQALVHLAERLVKRQAGRRREDGG
jgi:transcriptional regulator with XRE-family HTH domain